MLTMQYPIEIPTLVAEALALAESLGFDVRPEGNPAGANNTSPSCCLNEAGALLKVLTATITAGHVGEIGTGAGVGAAWIVSGLQSEARFTSVELVAHLARAASGLFQAYPNVEILHGDWKDAFREYGPFDLLFADGGGVGGGNTAQWQTLAALMNPGGIMLMDDVTPEQFWPEDWRGKPDPKRELAFNSGYFQSVEVRVRADASVLLMVRKESPTGA